MASTPLLPLFVPLARMVKKTSVGEKQLDGPIKSKMTSILGFDAPLEEDRKSKFEDRRLMLED